MNEHSPTPIIMSKRLLTLFVAALCAAATFAQMPQGRRVGAEQNEYAMSHPFGTAGDLIGLTLPQRIIELNITSYRWESSESSKASVEDSRKTSADIRLRKGGSTVVKYVYTYEVPDKEVVEVRNGKEEKVMKMKKIEASYPFTIKIDPVEPEMVSIAQELYLGWGQTQNVYKWFKIEPWYAETFVSVSSDDLSVARGQANNPNVIEAVGLGETDIHVATSCGIEVDAHLIVVVPAVSKVKITGSDKKMVIGDVVQLGFQYEPQHSEPDVHWTVDDQSVARIEPDGTLTALAEGKTVVHLVDAAGASDKFTLRVKKK